MVKIIGGWKRVGHYFEGMAELNGETYPIRVDAAGKVSPVPPVVPKKFMDALEDWASDELPLLDGMARTLTAH